MNQTQRNFKKEMNKGLKEVKKRDKDTYYKYLMRNHLDNPKQRYIGEKNEKVKGFFGKTFKTIFNIIIIIVFFSGAGAYINGKIQDGKPIIAKDLVLNTVNNNAITSSTTNSNQQNIIKYLNTIRIYESKINADINLRNKDVDSVNKKSLTKREYTDNLIVYKNRINSNSIKIDNISCPKELNNYKTMVQQQNKILCTAIDFEIQSMNSNDTAIMDKSSKNFKNYNEINKRIFDELNNVLDKNGIRR